MRWVGHEECMGDRRGAYSGLVGRPEERNNLEDTRRKWEDNIKMDYHEMGGGLGLD
jgi:hypothetical protein